MNLICCQRLRFWMVCEVGWWSAWKRLLGSNALSPAMWRWVGWGAVVIRVLGLAGRWCCCRTEFKQRNPINWYRWAAMYDLYNGDIGAWITHLNLHPCRVNTGTTFWIIFIMIHLIQTLGGEEETGTWNHSFSLHGSCQLEWVEQEFQIHSALITIPDKSNIAHHSSY